MRSRKEKEIEQQRARFIEAGNKARELRKELAATWLASEQIIQAMRELRQAIPSAQQRKQLIDDQTLRLEPSDTTTPPETPPSKR